MVISRLLLLLLSHRENRNQQKNGRARRHAEEGDVHAVHLRLISVSGGGRGADRHHDAHKHRRADGARDGTEGSEQRGRVGHLLGLHVAGAPGQKRHHQAADGDITDHVQNGGHPERRAHGKEKHADVADHQGRGARGKNLFDPHFIVKSPRKGADHRSGKGAGQGNQAGNHGGISHNALHVQRHHHGGTHHDQIEDHAGNHAHGIIPVAQNLHIQEGLFQPALAPDKEHAHHSAGQKRQACLHADQPEFADIADTQGNAAEGENALQEGNSVEFLILQLQHILKDEAGQHKGKAHDHQNQPENGFPAERVNHQPGDGGRNDRRRRCCQAIGSHHGSFFLYGIYRQNDHLRRRHQDTVSTGLQDSSHHHHPEVSGKNTQKQPDNKACDSGQIQPFCGKPGDEKNGQRHDHPHGEGVAAGRPLSHGGADSKIFHHIRQRRRHCRGQGGGRDA